ADEPEKERDGEVRADRKDVPDERTLEIRPDRHLVRDREHVVRVPSASDVNAREDERADDGKDRHRLTEAVDRRAPFLAEQEEDGADERSGVTDTDPPDEVRDVPRPVDRRVISPDAYAGPEEMADSSTEDTREGRRDEESDPPAARGLVL